MKCREKIALNILQEIVLWKLEDMEYQLPKREEEEEEEETVPLQSRILSQAHKQTNQLHLLPSSAKKKILESTRITTHSHHLKCLNKKKMLLIEMAQMFSVDLILQAQMPWMDFQFSHQVQNHFCANFYQEMFGINITLRRTILDSHSLMQFTLAAKM